MDRDSLRNVTMAVYIVLMMREMAARTVGGFGMWYGLSMVGWDGQSVVVVKAANKDRIIDIFAKCIVPATQAGSRIRRDNHSRTSREPVAITLALALSSEIPRVYLLGVRPAKRPSLSRTVEERVGCPSPPHSLYSRRMHS